MAHWGSLSTLPSGVSNVLGIAAGVNHCLALKDDGTVVSWGGQTFVPSSLSNVVEIAAGYDHSLALKHDGTLVTWGVTNTYGRAYVPSVWSSANRIACGPVPQFGSVGRCSVTPQVATGRPIRSAGRSVGAQRVGCGRAPAPLSVVPE